MTIATVSANSLATALAATIPFASRDETLPAVCTVQIRCGGGILTATATDRYVIGHARQAATGQLDRPWHLHWRDARALRKSISRHMNDRQTGADLVTLAEDGDTLTVKFGHTTLALTEPKGVKNAPDLAPILGKLPTGTDARPTPPFGLSRRVIRPLMKAAEWHPYDPMRWTVEDPSKPIRVDLGDWFVAAIMPVSLRGDEGNVPVDLPAVEAVAR